MPRVVFTHAVSDVDHWVSKHSERVEAFAFWGKNVVDGFNADGSNSVSMSVDVHDLEGMQATLTSPELASANEAHGVIEPVSMFVQSVG